jgi:hypothetical protein
MVKVCVVIVQLLGSGIVEMQLVSPPPRFGQFTTHTALGGLMTLIFAVSLALRYVPGMLAVMEVEEMLVTLMAVSVPLVAAPVKVTLEPPFCETGRKLLPDIAMDTFEHLLLQVAAEFGLTEESIGNGLGAP